MKKNGLLDSTQEINDANGTTPIEEALKRKRERLAMSKIGDEPEDGLVLQPTKEK